MPVRICCENRNYYGGDEQVKQPSIEAAAAVAARNLGFTRFFPEQKKVVLSFVEGHDMFVSLPNGFGKPLCFGVLPCVAVRPLSTKESDLIVH